MNCKLKLVHYGQKLDVPCSNFDGPVQIAKFWFPALAPKFVMTLELKLEG